MRKQMILLPLVFMLSGCSIVDSSSEISISLPSEMIVNREFTIGGYDSEMRVTVSNESVASVKDGILYANGVGTTKVTISEGTASKSYDLSVRQPTLSDEDTDVDNNFGVIIKSYSSKSKLVSTTELCSYQEGITVSSTDSESGKNQELELYYRTDTDKIVVVTKNEKGEYIYSGQYVSEYTCTRFQKLLNLKSTFSNDEWKIKDYQKAVEGLLDIFELEGTISFFGIYQGEEVSDTTVTFTDGILSDMEIDYKAGYIEKYEFYDIGQTSMGHDAPTLAE